MKWHKISEKLPPDESNIILSLLSPHGYSYYAGTFSRYYKEIRSHVDDGYQRIISEWTHWAEIEPPEETNNDN